MLGPSTGQELADLTHQAFDLADKYRIPVLILGDAMLGQMMEPVEFKHEAPEVPPSGPMPSEEPPAGPARSSRYCPPTRGTWKSLTGACTEDIS